MSDANTAGNDWHLPWTAHCRCGAMTMTVSAPPIVTLACHCRGCQRMTSGAYSLGMAIPPAGLAVTGAEPVLGGAKTPGIRHMFCPECLSWIYTDFPEMGFVSVRASLLDDASWFVPFVETQTAEKLPGAETGATISYQRFPEIEAWQDLTERFAREGRRPVA